MISLETARRIVAETRDEGRAMGLKPRSVAVLDPGVHLLAFEREDGASPGQCEIARGKAYGAVMSGIPGSPQMAGVEDQACSTATVTGVFQSQVVPVPGGILVKDGDGAVGVTGDTSDNDAEAGLAGITAGPEGVA